MTSFAVEPSLEPGAQVARIAARSAAGASARTLRRMASSRAGSACIMRRPTVTDAPTPAPRDTATRLDMPCDVPCNLCGEAHDYQVVFARGVAQVNQIVRCTQCGLMYSNPRDQLDDAADVMRFEPEGFLLEVEGEEGSLRHRRNLEKQRLQVRDYDSTRSWLAARHPRRGRLLEVGSALGYLLDFFREDGWDVSGLDPWAEAVLYSRKAMKIETMQGTLQEAVLEPSSIDAMLMMHVIEHLPDPAADLRVAFDALRPGGHFVLETPRYDTLMFKLMGRRERSVACPGHIYFFTSDTLRRLCERVGFRVVRHDFVGRSLTGDRLAYNIGVVSKSAGMSRVLDALSSRLRLDKLALTINLRDMQRIYLEKP